MNEAARRAVFYARQEAVDRGAPEIDTEHLLLGVLRSDPDLARSVAAAAQYEESTLARRMAQLSPTKPKPAAERVEIPLSEGASEVLAVARRQFTVELAPADLLVALIKVDGVASQVLREVGVTERMVQEHAAAPISARR